ncbi:MAG: hypothetical protein ACHQJ6_03320 [Candidatus Berkiellales bacterium]
MTEILISNGNNHKEPFLKELELLAKKVGCHGTITGHPSYPPANELSLHQKLTVLIMMREPADDKMKHLIKELEELGTNLRREYQMAQAFGLNEIAELLKGHAATKKPKKTR